MTRGSTGLVGQNTSCKVHKGHIKSIVGVEAHVRRAVLALAGLKYLCNTSERK